MHKSAFVFITSAFFSLPLLANGTVDYLQVDGDIVIFGTSGEKAVASPACATGDKWTVNLATDSGKANYALLMSAMSGKLSVEVGSAGDCADSAAIERSAAVTITGSASGADELPTNYTSCADILRQNPGAADGVYLIDPDLVMTSIEPFSVYCDMTRDGGGWTLMARAKQGDLDGWTSSTSTFLNFQRRKDPAGGTFRIAKSALPFSTIRILRDSFPTPIFFANHYNQTKKACSDAELTNCTYSIAKAGHGGYQHFIADDKVHIITYATEGNGWYVGDGTTNNYANGLGEAGTLTTLDSGLGSFDTSFTEWIR